MTTTPQALIVAVEPDGEQASRLVAMARRHLRAEFVVEGTAAAALKALRDRVPDLILTPVLLSSRDETLLIEHLRKLGAAGAHVQTLGIPILSAAEPTIRERGSRLIRRRQRPEAEQDGCELSVFADQVKIYLERAATERAAAEQQTATEMVPDTAPVQEVASSDSTADVVVDAVEPVVMTETYEEWLPVELPAAEPPAPDPVQTRALEAEFGLGPVPGHVPQLWRVATGAADLNEESRPENPAPVFVSATPMPMRRRARTHKPSPVLDDWAYFDPTQSGFKALIRRLDEIAAQYLAADAADAGSASSARL
jgi:hypothetical protein